MTMEIKMLKAIADAAFEMATAMRAVIDDCAEQLAKRKAAGEAENAIWSEPFAQAKENVESGYEVHCAAQVASGAPESNAGTPAVDASGFSDASDVSDTSAEPKLTIVELRAYVAERSTPENRPIIKEILNKFGVKKLTEMKEEQYRPLMEAVRKACS